MASDYERFIVVNGQTVTLVAGNTYTNPAYYNGSGAAGEVQGGTLTAVGTTENKIVFTGNTAEQYGGAVHMASGIASTAIFTDVTFTGNTANVSVYGGYSGGAMSIFGGSATFDNVTFSENTAASNDSYIHGNGGAVYISGGSTAVSITGATFTDNSAFLGGAVYVSGGTANFTDVTFSNNNTASSWGGAVNVSGATASFNDVTFNNNTGGAVYTYSNSVVTISGSVTLATSADLITVQGKMIWDLTKATADHAVVIHGWQYFSSSGTLYLNVSENFKVGDSFVIATDFGRSTSTKTFTLTGIAGVSDVSITTAGAAVDYNGQFYRLVLGDDQLTLCVIEDPHFTRFVATSANPVTLVAGNTYTNPFFYAGSGAAGEVQQGGTLTAVGTTENKIVFAGNTASQSGGAVYIRGTASFTDVTFTGNKTSNGINSVVDGGGAVYISGTASFTDVTFTGNSTSNVGGAAYVDGRTAIFEESVFCGNSAVLGGAIQSYGSSSHLRVAGSTFTDNRAVARGGAANITDNMTGVFDRVLFCGNRAGECGGAVNLWGGTSCFWGGSFDGNQAGRGGAISLTYTLKTDVARSAVAIVDGVTFRGNSAGQGGAIYVADVLSSVVVTGSTFTGNSACGDDRRGGGAVSITEGSGAFENVVFDNNYAQSGGGAVQMNGGSASFCNVIFCGNTSRSGVGAIWISLDSAGWQGGVVTLCDVTFHGNRGSGYAGEFGVGARMGAGAITNYDGIIHIAGSVSLETSSDTIYNAGTLNWDLTRASDTNAVVLNNFRYLENEDALTITVNSKLKLGNYTIATGVGSSFGDKNTFTITGVAGQSDVSITVGGDMKEYNSKYYQLVVVNDELRLNVMDNPTSILYTLDSSYGDVYDGQEHSVSVTVINPPTGAKISYSIDNQTSWQEGSSYALTNVGTVNVYFKIEATGYETVITESRSISIAKRSVTLTSASDTKLYDGMPLTNDTITVSGDGWAAGEGATYTVTGSQTEVGSSLNTFTYTLNAETEAANYNITKTEGTLTVTSVAKIPFFVTGDFAGVGRDYLGKEGDSDSVLHIYQTGAEWGNTQMEDGWKFYDSVDFNGDGKADLLRSNTENKLVVGEVSNGNGTFTPQVLNALGDGWQILGTGDFNGNGVGDVLVANPTAASATVGLLGYWEGGTAWNLINGYSAEWEMVSTNDFNGDGKTDMLWKNEFIGEGGKTYNAYCTWIVDNANDWRMVSVANPDEWNFLCTGDFDGDNTADIAMINGEGVVGIWGIQDGYLSSWSILSAVDTNTWNLAGSGDFNGDGTDDIAWCNADTNLAGYWQINDKQLTSWQTIGTLA